MDQSPMGKIYYEIPDNFLKSEEDKIDIGLGFGPRYIYVNEEDTNLNLGVSYSKYPNFDSTDMPLIDASEVFGDIESELRNPNISNQYVKYQNLNGNKFIRTHYEIPSMSYALDRIEYYYKYDVACFECVSFNYTQNKSNYEHYCDSFFNSVQFDLTK